VGKYMMDMLVIGPGLRHDGGGHAAVVRHRGEAHLPWLGLHDHHHFYQHDGGFRPVECEQIDTWYSQQHLYLLQQMSAVDMGGTRCSTRAWCSSASRSRTRPATRKNNMPFPAGGRRRHAHRALAEVPSLSHNNLLVSILSLFGDPRQSFGDPSTAPAADGHRVKKLA
jgi:hypothetical protein